MMSSSSISALNPTNPPPTTMASPPAFDLIRLWMLRMASFYLGKGAKGGTPSSAAISWDVRKSTETPTSTVTLPACSV